MSQALNVHFDDNLVPLVGGTIEVAEEEKAIFSVFGEDVSGDNRTIGIQIRSLVQHGHLYDHNTNKALKINQVISGGSSTIKYVGEKDFFNEPYEVDSEPIENYFFFSVVVAIEGGGYITSLKMGRQNITVINVNDTPTLSIPYSSKHVSTFTSLSWNSEECLSQSNNGKCKSKLVFDDIEANDVDGNFDYVRVDVRSYHGILTLNEDHINKANFAGCSNRSNLDINQVVWECKGTGFGDLKMTFTARSNDITNIFSNMTYESLVPGDDDIIISIHDGIGGECLSFEEHSYNYKNNRYQGRPTIHRQCTSVVRSQSVKVLKDKTFANNQPRKFPLQLMIAIVVAALVLFIIFVFSPIMRWWKARKESHPKEGIKKSTGAGMSKLYFSRKNKKRKIMVEAGGIKKKNAGNIITKRTTPYPTKTDRKNEWIKHYDTSTRDHYYENTRTRRVTWTKPDQSGDDGS